MKYILKYKLFFFIVGIIFFQSSNILATDNSYTMGKGSNQLEIQILTSGKYYILKETVPGNNSFVRQFYSSEDLFSIKIGSTVITSSSTIFTKSDVSAITTGVSQEVTKSFLGVYNSQQFTVIIKASYNTSNPGFMTLQATVDATAIPSGTPISLAYGFDAYVNGCDGGAAITVPDLYNKVDQSVNLSQTQVRGLRMVGGINSKDPGSLIAFIPMGKPFDRAYSACYTNAYSSQVINQAINSNLFKFGSYAVPSCGGGCSSNPWDNGIGVVYDNIVAGQTTDIRTGLTFIQDLDGQLDYTWNGSKNLVANLGDNINLNLEYTSYNAETLANVGFKVNLPGLKINSGGCTQSGFNSGNFGCVLGNEYYQLTNGNINSMAVGNIVVPVQVTQCGQWSIDGDAISDMVRTLPLGTPAVLTVKSNVGLASTTNIGICKGGSSVITVKLPDGVTPAQAIEVALSYTGSTSSFTTLPVSVIIPAGQNSASFTIISNASAADNSSLQVTLASTNQEFATINSAKTVIVSLYNTPVINNTFSNQTTCAGTSVSAINLTGSVAGTTFTWTTDHPEIGLANGSGSTIPQFTAVNNTNAPITATITVTPTANGCDGIVKQYTIKVNPTPSVSNILNNQTYCNGDVSPLIAFTGNVTGTTYKWTNSHSSIGLAVNGEGNIPQFTATNTTNAPITATIKVTPTANGCDGIAKEYTITVRPIVLPGNIDGNPYVCEGDVPQIIRGTAATGGSGGFTYQWQKNEGSGWVNINGATGADYLPGVLVQNTNFKRLAIDINCGSFESNTFQITKIPANISFTWKSNAGNNNWNDPANWSNSGGLVNAVPTKCSDVHIPGSAENYPSLDDNTILTAYGNPVTDKIIFHFGGEVAYPHKLTYKKAFIQYNWGYYAGNYQGPIVNAEGNNSPIIPRDKWYMLAAPLKKMASGDFALGGYPLTWQSLYNTLHPSSGNLIAGDFTKAFATNDIDLSTTNNALAVKVAAYNSNIGYNNHAHLENLKGILEIPYFENSTLSAYHPGHVYNAIRKESRFYYFDEKTLQQLASPIGTMRRSNEAYRFVYELDNEQTPHVTVHEEGIEKSVLGYNLPDVSSGSSTSKQVMLGNPFMASINSRQFFEANSLKLNEAAGYYLLTPTNQSWSRIDYKTENNISALQAFVVTLADGVTITDIVYPLEGKYALTGASYRGATRGGPSGRSLYIRTTDGSNSSSDYAILNAEEEVKSSGVNKMIYPDSHAVTEPFIISPDQEYNLIEFYDGSQKEVGLGVKSSNQKDVLSLEFENVESFVNSTGLRLILIDKFLRIEQDLTVNNIYRFNQRTTGSETQYSDVDRFSLRLSSATSGIENEINSGDLVTVIYNTGQLEVTSQEGLKQIDVYDLQGRHMHGSGNLNDAPTAYSKYLPLNHGVYIVKVQTAKRQIVSKKIIAM